MQTFNWLCPGIQASTNSTIFIRFKVLSRESGWRSPNRIMASRPELSEFEWGMVVEAKRIGHSISEVVLTFNIPRPIMSSVYKNTSWMALPPTSGQRHGCPRVLHDCDQQRLTNFIHANRQTTLDQITFRFNAGSTRAISITSFSIHGIWGQKTHQSAFVNIPTLDTAPHLDSWTQ